MGTHLMPTALEYKVSGTPYPPTAVHIVHGDHCGGSALVPWKLSGMPNPSGQKSSHCSRRVELLVSGWSITSCNAPILNFPRPTVASPGVERELRSALPLLEDAVVGVGVSSARRGTVAHCRKWPELAVAALPEEAVCGVFGWRQDGIASFQLGSMYRSLLVYLHVKLTLRELEQRHGLVANPRSDTALTTRETRMTVTKDYV